MLGFLVFWGWFLGCRRGWGGTSDILGSWRASCACLSAISLPGMPLCDGTHMSVGGFGRDFWICRIRGMRGCLSLCFMDRDWRADKESEMITAFVKFKVFMLM